MPVGWPRLPSRPGSAELGSVGPPAGRGGDAQGHSSPSFIRLASVRWGRARPGTTARRPQRGPGRAAPRGRGGHTVFRVVFDGNDVTSLATSPPALRAAARPCARIREEPSPKQKT